MFFRTVFILLISISLSQSEPVCVQDADEFFSDLRTSLFAANNIASARADLCNETQIQLIEKEAELEMIRKNCDEQNAENPDSAILVELSAVKAAYHDLQKHIEILQEGKKNISDQHLEAKLALKDANSELNQLREHNDNLETEVNGTKDALRDAEAKLAAANTAFDQIRTEMENRLRGKDEEIYFIRSSSQRAIAEMDRNLVDLETRHKTEITDIKNTYDTNIRELEESLNNARETNDGYLEMVNTLKVRVEELENLLEKAAGSLVLQ